jgi:hypothetical protein
VEKLVKSESETGESTDTKPLASMESIAELWAAVLKGKHDKDLVGGDGRVGWVESDP